jgi:hypothetical protein
MQRGMQIEEEEDYLLQTGGGSREVKQQSGLIHVLKCLFYISLWYVGTLAYNLINKRLLM